ncbi:MAG: WbqC family protein [Chitinophagaceae bacterium]|nr:WbqC family protein [Chitinophagaceae bacterium]
MSSLIVESQYFGSVTYINTLFHYTDVKIDVCEAYRKMSFRNRSVVAGGNGLVHLSVPLLHGRDRKQLTREVEISYHQDWQKQHWRTLTSCYQRAPFFEYYADWLAGFYEKKPRFLLDMNQEILDWLVKVLKLPVRPGTWDGTEPLPAGYADGRNRWLPNQFQQVPASFQYYQVFADRIGFQPNLSILDLLFCTGPEAHSLLAGNIPSI